MAAKKLELILVRSLSGLGHKQEATIRALGLRRIRQRVTHDDTPTIRGMIARVVHCLDVREVDHAR